MKTFIREEVQSDRAEVQEQHLSYFYHTPLFVDPAGIKLEQKLFGYDGFPLGVMVTKMSFAEAIEFAKRITDLCGGHKDETFGTKRKGRK